MVREILIEISVSRPSAQAQAKISIFTHSDDVTEYIAEPLRVQKVEIPKGGVVVVKEKSVFV